ISIYLGDHHRFDFFVSFGFQNSVRRVNLHTRTCQFVFMNLVTTTFRGRFYEPSHVNTSLDGVVASNQTDISAANDKQVFTWLDQISVNKSLEGTRAEYARQGVARK